jgi:hypothetical protein
MKLFIFILLEIFISLQRQLDSLENFTSSFKNSSNKTMMSNSSEFKLRSESSKIENNESGHYSLGLVILGIFFLFMFLLPLGSLVAYAIKYYSNGKL